MHPSLPSLRVRSILPLALAAILLFASGQGCPVQPASPGPQIPACWDVNANGSGDASEDINGDGAVDTRDCQPSSRVYGDGSAGPLTIAVDTLWTAAAGTPPPGNNAQFTDLVVEAGVTLVVPSGIVIRCTGTFTNHGTIMVNPGAVGALVDVDASADPGSIHGTNYRQPGQGIALCPPGPGEYATPTVAPPESGFGGCGMNEPLSAMFLLYPGMAGGGGGAAASSGLTTGTGGDGGGALVVRARGAFVNTGTIRANGDAGQSFGCGGGGGGVIILASGSSIASNAPGALISARGGAGGESNTTRAPGGGGGGGIVHLIAPSIAANAIDVTGGLGGNVVGSITTHPHQAGAGGGGSYGSGGDGGDGAASVPGTPGTALTAGSGIVLQTIADPGTLF